MAKGVKKPGQISVKMSGQSTRNSQPWTGKLSGKKKDNKDWMKGKTPGTNLSEYVLDMMILN